MNELALFAGAGGGILGGKLLGWNTICACEIDPYARSVLLARQNDGTLPAFPVWDDIRTFDGRPWRGAVDVVSGGFPCQDISAAGGGAGLDGARSGLWAEMAMVICEVRPRFALVENSPVLTSRGLHRVLGDLAEMGFDARWGVLGASHVGAPHRRERIWIVAHANMRRGWADATGRDDAAGQDTGRPEANGLPGAVRPTGGAEGMADADGERAQGLGEGPQQGGHGRPAGLHGGAGSQRERHAWPAEPAICRVAHGLANRVDRVTALGNGQVPRVAAAAWRILTHN
jgi:DNA (cytosine-5)-methyltransferase 1